MEKSRYQKLHRLMQPVDYWSTRAATQLRYLEALFQCGLWTDEALLQRAVDRLYGIYQASGNLYREAVLAWEKEYLEPVRMVAKQLRVDCVGHAHIDMNWQWGYDETVMVTVDTFRTMLQLMEEYPDFVFLQSQASVYHIVETHAPELLPGIRRAIRAGQWEPVASTWVEADKNMPSGESMTRHLLYTKKYLKALLELRDEDFLVDFEPDTFGHGAQVPTVLASGGVRYYYHCRGEAEQSLYRWEAPSGAKITVLRDPEWYNSPITWDAFLYIPAYCTRYGIKRMCHVFGVGDHGGGVTRRDIQRIHDMASWSCMPEIGFGRLRDFFAYTDSLELPVVSGERNFIFDGCYTTQSRIKRGNRMAEAALYRAEALNAFSALKGDDPYVPGAFENAWRKVLFNQFHDILPGSGVTATREYAMGAYQEALACAGVRTEAAARALSAAIDTGPVLAAQPPLADSTSEGAGVGFGTPSGQYTASGGIAGGENRLFHVFNPTQAAWEGLVELTVWDWPFAPGRAAVCDETGAELPIFLVDMAARDYWAHRFFRVLVQCPVPAFGYRTLLLKENDCPPEMPVYAGDVFPRVDTPEDCLALENDCIRVELDTASLRIRSLRDRATGIEYLDTSKTGGLDYVEEDDSQGMTAWRMGRHISQTPALESLRLTGRVNHPLRSGVSFTGQIKRSQVEGSMWLDRGSRMLHIGVHCRWREMGAPGQPIPQLAFSLPLKRPADGFVCDTPFMAVKREAHAYDVPALSYAYASGVMLTTDSKYGFRCTGDTLGVTLLRSAYDPDELPEVGNHDFVIGVGIPEDGGPYTLFRESLRFSHPPMAVAATPHGGTLPPAGQLMAVTGDMQVSCVKMAEDGSGDMVIRVVNLGDTPQTVGLTPPCPVREAWRTDAHEQPGEVLDTCRDGSVSVTAEPFSVLALRLRF